MKFVGYHLQTLTISEIQLYEKDSCFETHSTFTRAGVFYAMMSAESLVSESTIREMD
jgi:hypothetical protein